MRPREGTGMRRSLEGGVVVRRGDEKFEALVRFLLSRVISV